MLALVCVCLLAGDPGFVAVGEQFPPRMERVTGLLEKMKLLALEKKGIREGDLQKASENAHTISEGGTSGLVLRVPMKFMAWNCQGLGNALTMRGLLRCQRSVQADILFLSETRLDDRGMERIKFSFGLSNLLVVKGDGKGGGIVVLWRTWVNVSLRTYSINHIDVDVVEDDGFAWLFTGIYGEPRMELKHRTWKLLRDLHGL